MTLTRRRPKRKRHAVERLNQPNPIAALEGLGKGIFRVLCGLGLITTGVLVVLILVIVNLWNVAANQKATIDNQKEIAEASNVHAAASREIIKKSLEMIDKVSNNLERLTVLYLAQEQELVADKSALREIIMAERTMVTEQADVLKAAKQASAEAAAAASQTRNTNRTISEKVVTTKERDAVTKQTAKNVEKGKELKALAKTIKKAEHQ
jgi:hypothetical protein